MLYPAELRAPARSLALIGRIGNLRRAVFAFQRSPRPAVMISPVTRAKFSEAGNTATEALSLGSDLGRPPCGPNGARISTPSQNQPFLKIGTNQPDTVIPRSVTRRCPANAHPEMQSDGIGKQLPPFVR